MLLHLCWIAILLLSSRTTTAADDLAPIPSPEDASARFARLGDELAAKRYPEVVAGYAQLRTEHPDWVWPRLQRYQQAYALFRTNQVDAAEARWAALLCENHRDPLSFRIAYYLALAQDRLGKAALAYETLRVLPAETSVTHVAASQKVFRDLQLQLAAKLGVKSDPAPLKGSRIDGLKIAARRIYRRAVAGEPEPEAWVEIVGVYPKTDRRLYCAGAPVTPDAQGRFKLDLMVDHGAVATLLLATDAYGAIEHQLAVYPPNAPAAASGGARVSGRLRLRTFGLSLNGAFQSIGSSSFFPEPHWNPSYRLAERWEAVLRLGLFFSREASGNIFAGIDGRLLAAFLFSRLRIEGGGGVQTWIAYGPSALQLTGAVGYDLAKPLLHSIRLDSVLCNAGTRFDVASTFMLGLEGRVSF